MIKETKKSAPKYKLPSQRILDIVEQARNSDTPMNALDISLMTSFAILDKLEEVALVLRSFMPRAEEKKHDA